MMLRIQLLLAILLFCFANCVAHREPRESGSIPKRKPHPQARKQSDPNEITCNLYDGNNWSFDYCKPGQYCGIDKVTGYGQGCLDASKCPASVASAPTIFCDKATASCCCEHKPNTGVGNPSCNDILGIVYDNVGPQWKQACALEELKNLHFCKYNPDLYEVFCAGSDGNDRCSVNEFCGIDRKTGLMKTCVWPNRCPANARFSEKIVCDSKAEVCCCQKMDKKNDYSGTCNNLYTDTVWQEACGLPELKHLDIAVNPKPGNHKEIDYESGASELRDGSGMLTVLHVMMIIIGQTQI